ncbi:MAG: hypothetical protein V4560_00815 [Bacteroidota bacterium]
MNKFFRFIIAAWGAKKLGGGCLSTIVIFVIIYMLLGKCGNDTKAATLPVHVKVTISK